MNLQQHQDTPQAPTHHKKPQTHKEANKPQGHREPSRPSGHRGGSSHNQHGVRRKAHHTHKSSPETERTLLIGSGVRVRIPSTAELPMRERKD